jgi:hypothetical protein
MCGLTLKVVYFVAIKNLIPEPTALKHDTAYGGRDLSFRGMARAKE